MRTALSSRFALRVALLAALAPTAAFAQSTAPETTAPAAAADPIVAPMSPADPGISPAPVAPVAPVVLVAPVAPVVPAPLSVFPLDAGFRNDVFYVSSADHEFVLIPSGRFQVDGVYFVGPHPGVDSDYTSRGAYHAPDVRDGFLIRRARVELLGLFLRRYSFHVSGDFASTISPNVFDAYISARAHELLNFQVGQFSAPFTAENRSSDLTDFVERALVVRAFSMPSQREIGAAVWGEGLGGRLYYMVGVFNGDGQSRTNRDSYFDGMGRVAVRPFFGTSLPFAGLQIGGSFRYGGRGASVDYPYPNMTTVGGYTFFNAQLASGSSPVTIVPDAEQRALGADLDIPIGRFDLRGEFVWMSNNTAEMAALATDAAHLVGNSIRRGTLEGTGFYVQAGFWPWGAPGLNGRLGYQVPPRIDFSARPQPPAPMGLQVVVRFEGLDFRYTGGSRSDTPSASTGDGRYQIYAATAAVNFWATRHVRFTLSYEHYFFPGQPADSAHPGADDNRLHGPHNNGDSYGEVLARVGLHI